MKKIVFFVLLWFLTEGVVSGQIPGYISESFPPGTIIGGAGFLKYTVGSPDSIAKIQVIDERYTAAFAWDTFRGKLYQYNHDLPVGKRWVASQFVQYSNNGYSRRDSAFKFIVDTTNRQIYICNQSGCLNVSGNQTAVATITASNGVNINNNEVKLGGVLSQNTNIITTPTTANLKILGLASSIASNDSVLMVNGLDGALSRRSTGHIQRLNNQVQRISYSSNYSGIDGQGNLLPPTPVTATLGNQTSLVQFGDTNNGFYVEANMTVVLPTAPSVWNRSIRIMPSEQTASASFSTARMFETLTFSPPAGSSIQGNTVFTNVPYNAVFECQYFSDTNKWFIVQL